MKLRRRVEELERQASVKPCDRGIHLHEGWKNPRTDCRICKAMSEEEYAAYLEHGDGRMVIEIVEQVARAD